MEITEQFKILKSLKVHHVTFQLGMMDYLEKEKEVKSLLDELKHGITIQSVIVNKKEEFRFSMYGVYATFKLKL